MPHALVTGASSGIGLALANQLERQGFSLVVASRDPGERPGALTISLDLSEPGAAPELFERTRHLPLDVVVCNAGFGRIDEHLDLDLEEITRMAHLNMTALVEMCTLFGRPLRERRQGYLLTVASIAGFFPIPYFAEYAATKAFVVSFSRALGEELRPYGVGVTCLCPGPTLTNFRTRPHRPPANRDNSRAMSAETVAQAGLEGMWKGRRVVIPGAWNRLLTRVGPLLPPALVAAWLRRRLT